MCMMESTGRHAVSVTEVAALSEAIAEVYSMASTVDSLRNIVQLVSRAIGHTEIGVIHLESGADPVWISSMMSEETVQRRRPLRSEILHLVTKAMERDLTIWHPRDAIGEDEWKRTQLYQQMADAGIGDLICLSCITGPDESTHFHLAREQADADFDGVDIALLRRLHDHFIKAAQLRSRLHEAEAVRLAFQKMVRAGFICSSEFRIVRMNEAAARFIEDIGDEESLTRVVQDTARRIVSKGDQWEPLDCCGEKSLMTVYPVESGDTPVNYVVVLDLARNFRAMLAQCMAGGGLTERETEICAMIMRGDSNRKIARALFIEESTVKDHVTRILHKFDVSNRAAIVPRLLGLDLSG